MIKNAKRLFIGVVSAPMFVLFVLPLFNCVYQIFKQRLSCVQGIVSFAFYGLPVVAISITVAFPLIYLFLKKRWVGIIHFGIGGAIVAMVVAGLLIVFGEGTNVVGTLLTMLVMGVCSALLTWLFAIRNNLN